MEGFTTMSRHTRPRLPFVAALAAISLAAGCGDSRMGGPQGMQTPGSQAAPPDRKGSGPANPEIATDGGASGPASK